MSAYCSHFGRWRQIGTYDGTGIIAFKRSAITQVIQCNSQNWLWAVKWICRCCMYLALQIDKPPWFSRLAPYQHSSMLVTSSTFDLKLFGYMTSSGVIALSLFHLFLQYPSDSKAVPEEASAILSTGTCVSQFSLCSTVCLVCNVPSSHRSACHFV